MSLITLAEAKTLLSIALTSATVEDPLLQDFIDAAESSLEEWTGPLTVRDFTDEVTTNVWGGAILPRQPVQSITSVTDWSGSVLDAGSYRLAPGGVVRSLTPNMRCTVAYKAGRPDGQCPPALRQAAREQLRHLWSTQRAARSAGTEQPPPGSAHSMPYRVEELIQPYLTGGFA